MRPSAAYRWQGGTKPQGEEDMKHILGAVLGAAITVAAVPAAAQQVDARAVRALRTEVESIVVSARLARPDGDYRGISLSELAEAGLPGLARGADGIPATSFGRLDVRSTVSQRLRLPGPNGEPGHFVEVKASPEFEVVLSDAPAWACANLAAYPVGFPPVSVAIDGSRFGRGEIRDRSVGVRCFDGRGSDGTVGRLGLVYR